jgi:hypothetical protein
MFLVVAALFAAADYSEKKQGVTITYVGGNSEKVKLDFIDKDNVIIIKQGSDGLQSIKQPRSKVDSLSMDGRDFGKQFGAGEEGFVMADGRVLKGIVEGLDETSFFRRLSPGGRTEQLDRDQVVFIQFRKPAQVTPNQPDKPVQKATVEVSAKQAWTVTDILVKKGQRVYFTVDPAKPILCGGVANVNADGVEPYVADRQRPLGDEKACALIAKIGSDLFRVGTKETPFVVKADGELLLGINDYKFVNNAGIFSVMILVVEQ